ncbi:hypothetical protein NHX12_020646 [Muraenolepis orangiensis]|uniref:Uncharacterized protein n=1 Tax=Muraenolepis orangiensis TaxID=630683 RepID=A0A9Q0IW07_9TELE|nr:hypothetical protein NHX12_020646 [Muraenolepis orangiensis]
MIFIYKGGPTTPPGGRLHTGRQRSGAPVVRTPGERLVLPGVTDRPAAVRLLPVLRYRVDYRLSASLEYTPGITLDSPDRGTGARASAGEASVCLSLSLGTGRGYVQYRIGGRRKAGSGVDCTGDCTGTATVSRGWRADAIKHRYDAASPACLPLGFKPSVSGTTVEGRLPGLKYEAG